MDEIEEMPTPAFDRDKTTAAAAAAGLDPGCFDWMWQSKPASEQVKKAVPSYRLTDDEWALLESICPPETRANAWSWREFFDVELWLRQSRNRLNNLENANAHRCRKRRAALRGDFQTVLDRLRDVEGLSSTRNDELVRILRAGVAYGERIRVKFADSRRGDAPEVRLPPRKKALW